MQNNTIEYSKYWCTWVINIWAPTLIKLLKIGLLCELYKRSILGHMENIYNNRIIYNDNTYLEIYYKTFYSSLFSQ